MSSITITPDRLAELRVQQGEAAQRARAKQDEDDRVASERVRLAEELGSAVAAQHLSFDEIRRIAGISERAIQFAPIANVFNLSEAVRVLVNEKLAGGVRSTGEGVAFVKGVKAVYESL